MKIHRYLFVLLILINTNAFAQSWKWARQATGDAPWEEGVSVATDNNDNVYLCGYLPMGNAIFGHDTITCYGLGNASGFLAKYDSMGNSLWARQSNGYSVPYAIATDKNNNIYETGYFIDTTFFGAKRLIANYYNVYLVKYDQNGNVLWATESSAKSGIFNLGNSVVTDTNENVYVTGTFKDSIKFGSFILISLSGNGNSFLVKYDSNGNVVWAKSFGGNGPNGDVASAVTVDRNNNPIITGSFSTSSLTFASSTLINYCQNTAFIAKYDANGNPMWATASIGSGNQSANGNCIVVDNTNNIYVSGSYSDNNITFGKDVLSIIQGPLFVVKYDASGNELWARAGKSGYSGTQPYAMQTDKCNDVYIDGGCGNSLGTSFTIDTVTYSVPSNSSDPAFVIELDSLGNILNGVMTPSGGDDWIGMALDNKYDIYFGGDFEINMFLGDSIYCTNQESAFVAKLSFGQPSCCKNTSEVIDTTLLPGDSILLNVTPAGSSYLWSTGATTSSIVVVPVTTTTYSVSVFDNYGCSHTASTVLERKCDDVFIPEAFSPNKDGKNDILYVRGDCIKTMDFVIFDRWGNKVFESNSLSIGWDGTFKGQPMNSGSFVYYLKAALIDGSQVEKKGSIALIR